MTSTPYIQCTSSYLQDTQHVHRVNVRIFIAMRSTHRTSLLTKQGDARAGRSGPAQLSQAHSRLLHIQFNRHYTTQFSLGFNLELLRRQLLGHHSSPGIPWYLVYCPTHSPFPGPTARPNTCCAYSRVRCCQQHVHGDFY